MIRRAVIQEVKDILNAQEFRSRRIEFENEFGRTIGNSVAALDGAIAELQRSRGPLPLNILQVLPQDLMAPLRSGGAALNGRVAKELVARWLDRLPIFLENAHLPSSVTDLYPGVVAYITRTITDEPDESYGDPEHSSFDKDLRMAIGVTVPVGALIVDLRCWLPRTLYRYQGWKENLRWLWFLRVRLGGLGPVFRSHTETRNLVDFNEAGRKAALNRMVDLLRFMPEVKGWVGTSWFYDPQLEEISPHLLHFRQVPQKAGAWLHRDGPGAIHTERAIAKSKTRRALFEQGRYLPICWTMVWRRADMLRWAENYRQGET